MLVAFQHYNLCRWNMTFWGSVVVMLGTTSSLVAQTTIGNAAKMERDETQTLLKQVLDYRWGIRDGNVEYTVVDPAGRETQWQGWFKGHDKLRIERDRPGQKSIRTANDVFSWSTIPNGPTLQPVRRSVLDSNREVFDVRVLGIDILPPTDLRGRLGENLVDELDLGVAERSVETTQLDGREVKLITIRFPTNCTRRYWIDFTRGPSVVKTESEGMMGSKKYILDRASVQLRDYNGVWFPERVQWTRFVNNSVIGLSAVATVTKAEFNTGLSDDTFKVGALGVPAGTYITDESGTPDHQLFFDGENVVSIDKREKREFPPVAVAAPASRWRLTLSWVYFALGLACFGAVAVRQVCRRIPPVIDVQV